MGFCKTREIWVKRQPKLRLTGSSSQLHVTGNCQKVDLQIPVPHKVQMPDRTLLHMQPSHGGQQVDYRHTGTRSFQLSVSKQHYCRIQLHLILPSSDPEAV